MDIKLSDEIVVSITVKKLNKSSSNSLYDEIQADTLKPTTNDIKTTNPFKVKDIEKVVKKVTAWSESEMKAIEYCTEKSSPPSHRTLNYLKLKLNRSESAIRNKLRSLGITVSKGFLCKN